jgi:hypothetical protein
VFDIGEKNYKTCRKTLFTMKNRIQQISSMLLLMLTAISVQAQYTITLTAGNSSALLPNNVYVGEYIHVQGNLVFDQNIVFDNCTLEVDPGVSIEVQACTTEFYDSEIYATSGMWDGIYLDDLSAGIHFEQSFLSDATVGIHSDHGAATTLIDSDFDHNQTHLKYTNYLTAPHSAVIRGNDFYFSYPGSFFLPNGNSYSDCGIVVENVQHITIGDGSDIDYKNTFDKCYRGINAHNSSLEVYNNEISVLTHDYSTTPTQAVLGPVAIRCARFIPTITCSLTVGEAGPSPNPYDGNVISGAKTAVLATFLNHTVVGGNEFFNIEHGVKAVDNIHLQVLDNEMAEVLMKGVYVIMQAIGTQYPYVEVKDNVLYNPAHFTYAVHITHNGVPQTGTVFIKDNWFEDFENGIYVKSTKGEIWGNKVFLNPGGQAWANHGIRLLNCDNLQVIDNDISLYKNVASSTDAAIFLDNSTDIRVSENYMFDCSRGLRVAGTTSMLEITCNRFEDCQAGVRFEGVTATQTLNVGGQTAPSWNAWTNTSMPIRIEGSNNSGLVVNWNWAGSTGSDFDPNILINTVPGVNLSIFSLGNSLIGNQISSTPTTAPCNLPPRIGSAEEELEAMLYPNPARHQLYVSVAEQSSLKLFSLNGQLLKEEALHYGTHAVQVSDLAAGVYFYEVQGSSTHERGKLIIAR